MLTVGQVAGPVAPTTALTVDQAHTRLHEPTVIDVRTPGEHVFGHLPGAHHIPQALAALTG